MIKSITVVNHLGESLVIDIMNPEKSGFIVKSIDGLGPVKASVNTKQFPINDGVMFNSARIDARNIVLNFRFLWKNTIEEVRHVSYRYFPVKKPITLLIQTSERLCGIYGYIESNEQTIFGTETGCQVSIVCPNPYFYDASKQQTTIFSNIMPNFEFPVSISNLEFSRINNLARNTIYYTGEADTGVNIEIHAVGPATNPSIINVITNEIMRIDTSNLDGSNEVSYEKNKPEHGRIHKKDCGSTNVLESEESGLVFGDTIHINTNTGSKSVILERDGKFYDILRCVGLNSAWFKLTSGDNIFSYIADTGASNLQFKMTNDILYGGI